MPFHALHTSLPTSYRVQAPHDKWKAFHHTTFRSNASSEAWHYCLHP